MRRLLWLAVSSLRRSPRRTILTSLALANAVTGGLVFYGFTRHTYWGLSESFARAGNGHVQIADADWFDAPAPEQHRTPVATLNRLAEALQADPELAPLIGAVSVRRKITGMLIDGERSAVFMGTGTDPAAEPVLAPLAHPLLGEPLHEAALPTGVLLGEPLAARLGVGPGDPVTAMVTTDAGMTNAMDLQVVGITRTGAEELDRVFATMSTETALRLASGDSADLLVVALIDTDDTDQALARVDAILAADPTLSATLESRPWSARATYYIAVKALYDRIFGIFEMLMVLVTALSLSHAVSAVVAERRSEIALLRVIGLRTRQVAGVFVAEGALLGILGATLGAIGANLAALIIQAAGGIPMPPPPGFTVGYNALIHLDALGYAVVLPATVLAAMVASAVPAWRASRGALSRVLAGMMVLLSVAAAPQRASAAAAPPPEGQALLVAADASRRTPIDQRCTVDMTIETSRATMRWRVALNGARVLAVTPDLPAGDRQAVLQDPAGTWFQTESMRKPMSVGARQRVMGEVSIADLLSPTLDADWHVTELRTGPPQTALATARPGGSATTATAEFEFADTGRLHAARYYAASGQLTRVAQYQWDGDRLLGINVTDGARQPRETRVTTSPPACVPGTIASTPATLLFDARALAANDAPGAPQ